MKNLLLRIALTSAGLLALLAACSVGDVDVTNKACPCGADYVCDTARNLCVLPQDLVNANADSGTTPGACSDPCPCKVDGDCKDGARPKCSAEKICVECVHTPDSCGAGTYCNSASQCTLGCKQESDCQISPAAPHCETTRHQCVECRTTGDCTGGKQCSPTGECVEVCDPPAGKNCANGRECCDAGGAKLCIDTKADVLNCGGCGTKCSTVNGTPKCTAGACTWTCANGFAHCASGNTGCEVNLRTDALHCGSCTRNCTTALVNANGITCNAGNCAYASCKTGFGNCDGNVQNGCECACGAAQGDTCCPGSVCSPGLKCVGANKCQPG